MRLLVNDCIIARLEAIAVVFVLALVYRINGFAKVSFGMLLLRLVPRSERV